MKYLGEDRSLYNTDEEVEEHRGDQLLRQYEFRGQASLGNVLAGVMDESGRSTRGAIPLGTPDVTEWCTLRAAT